MLGSDLAKTTSPDTELHSRDRTTLDVTNEAAVAATLDLVRPEIFVNATGYTAVDRSESAPEEAFAVNAIAVGTLGRLCARRGVRVVHFSTDYVFDGTSSAAYREDDRRAPVNVYGESKLAGEDALQDSGADALVVRAQWLFGKDGASFVRTMWDRACRGQFTRVVNDQWGRPTYTVELARATWELVAKRLTGTYHVANSGEATRYDVARQIFDAAGVTELLSPCASVDLPQPAQRPARSTLDTTKADHALGVKLPPWSTSLAEFLLDLQREKSSRVSAGP
jgi:dTDP-4-dehydrorhamnose reductase